MLFLSGHIAFIKLGVPLGECDVIYRTSESAFTGDTTVPTCNVISKDLDRHTVA